MTKAQREGREQFRKGIFQQIESTLKAADAATHAGADALFIEQVMIAIRRARSVAIDMLDTLEVGATSTQRERAWDALRDAMDSVEDRRNSPAADALAEHLRSLMGILSPYLPPVPIGRYTFMEDAKESRQAGIEDQQEPRFTLGPGNKVHRGNKQVDVAPRELRILSLMEGKTSRPLSDFVHKNDDAVFPERLNYDSNGNAIVKEKVRKAFNRLNNKLLEKDLKTEIKISGSDVVIQIFPLDNSGTKKGQALSA